MGCGQSSEAAPAARAPVSVPTDGRSPGGSKLQKQVTISDYEATVHQPTRRQVTIKNFAPVTATENATTPTITPAASGSDHQPHAAATEPAVAPEASKDAETVPPIPAATETPATESIPSSDPAPATASADEPPAPPAQETSQ